MVLPFLSKVTNVHFMQKMEWASSNRQTSQENIQLELNAIGEFDPIAIEGFQSLFPVFIQMTLAEMCLPYAKQVRTDFILIRKNLISQNSYADKAFLKSSIFFCNFVRSFFQKIYFWENLEEEKSSLVHTCRCKKEQQSQQRKQQQALFEQFTKRQEKTEKMQWPPPRHLPCTHLMSFFW